MNLFFSFADAIRYYPSSVVRPVYFGPSGQSNPFRQIYQLKKIFFTVGWLPSTDPNHHIWAL
jgi:hypothetical protein